MKILVMFSLAKVGFEGNLIAVFELLKGYHVETGNRIVKGLNYKEADMGWTPGKIS